MRVMLTETEQAGAFQRLQSNISTNAHLLPQPHSVSCSPLDWAEGGGEEGGGTGGRGVGRVAGGRFRDGGEVGRDGETEEADSSEGGMLGEWGDGVEREEGAKRVSHRGYEWVVGSDLVYSEGGASMLCSLLTRLLTTSPPPRCLYAHTAERWGAFGYDRILLQQLKAHRLQCTLVREGEEGSGGVGDAAPISQRCVLFEIRLLRRGEEWCEGGAERVLMRACRAQAARERAEREGMTEEERLEADVAYSISELWL